MHGDECEIHTLHTVRQWQGAGSVLIAAVRETAARRGCRRLWLVTTNDNVDALRFYQRRGFRLAALRPGAVDDARRNLKPEIAAVGEYGIVLRDELELELELPPGEFDLVALVERRPRDLDRDPAARHEHPDGVRADVEQRVAGHDLRELGIAEPPGGSRR